jgi:hypothetical protein
MPTGVTFKKIARDCGVVQYDSTLDGSRVSDSFVILDRDMLRLWERSDPVHHQETAYRQPSPTRYLFPRSVTNIVTVRTQEEMDSVTSTYGDNYYTRFCDKFLANPSIHPVSGRRFKGSNDFFFVKFKEICGARDLTIEIENPDHVNKINDIIFKTAMAFRENNRPWRYIVEQSSRGRNKVYSELYWYYKTDPGMTAVYNNIMTSQFANDVTPIINISNDDINADSIVATNYPQECIEEDDYIEQGPIGRNSENTEDRVVVKLGDAYGENKKHCFNLGGLVEYIANQYHSRSTRILDPIRNVISNEDIKRIEKLYRQRYDPEFSFTNTNQRDPYKSPFTKNKNVVYDIETLPSGNTTLTLLLCHDGQLIITKQTALRDFPSNSSDTTLATLLLEFTNAWNKGMVEDTVGNIGITFLKLSWMYDIFNGQLSDATGLGDIGYIGDMITKLREYGAR